MYFFFSSNTKILCLNYFQEIISNCIGHIRTVGSFTFSFCAYFVFSILQVVKMSWFSATFPLLLRVSPHGPSSSGRQQRRLPAVLSGGGLLPPRQHACWVHLGYNTESPSFVVIISAYSRTFERIFFILIVSCCSRPGPWHGPQRSVVTLPLEQLDCVSITSIRTHITFTKNKSVFNVFLFFSYIFLFIKKINLHAESMSSWVV